MCDSLPLAQPSPWRLGNEEMCAKCADSDCEHCAARHSTAVFCGHPCPYLYRLRAVPS